MKIKYLLTLKSGKTKEYTSPLPASLNEVDDLSLFITNQGLSGDGVVEITSKEFLSDSGVPLSLQEIHNPNF